jgi:5-(carboxyamino)imidazole ribonucleotide synthase
VDVVTFEFENVPAATLDALGRLVACRPGVTALAICQDRRAEKQFLEDVAGVPVAPWRAVETLGGLQAAVGELGLPSVLKTTRLGYDGRGQAVLRTLDDAAGAWTRLRPRPLILEGFVPFVAELSVIAARTTSGTVAVFDVVENRHENHILATSFAPARVRPGVAALAAGHAVRVAEALDMVGVLALELFLLDDDRMIANEIAPRPHNSGHWTMDACAASQFEQHVRAVTGLPLADPARHHDAILANLVGPAGIAAWDRLLSMRGVVPHLYGKDEVRPGRKMGHATRLLPIGSLVHLTEAELRAVLAGGG